MKFNFFVLIACLMIHFIAQAGNVKRAAPNEQTVQVKTERTVAGNDAPCENEVKK